MNEVEQYLARVPEPAHSTLQTVREMIRAAAPAESAECLSYGMPAFRYKGALVGYAAFKKHCSLFPMSGKLLDSLGDEVKDCRTSKGTLQFPQDQPPPKALVQKIVRLRVAENEAKNRRVE